MKNLTWQARSGLCHVRDSSHIISIWPLPSVRFTTHYKCLAVRVSVSLQGCLDNCAITLPCREVVRTWSFSSNSTFCRTYIMQYKYLAFVTHDKSQFIYNVWYKYKYQGLCHVISIWPLPCHTWQKSEVRYL